MEKLIYKYKIKACMIKIKFISLKIKITQYQKNI